MGFSKKINYYANWAHFDTWAISDMPEEFSQAKVLLESADTNKAPEAFSLISKFFRASFVPDGNFPDDGETLFTSIECVDGENVRVVKADLSKGYPLVSLECEFTVEFREDLSEEQLDEWLETNDCSLQDAADFQINIEVDEDLEGEIEPWADYIEESSCSLIN